ncbi:hypothetical protein ACOME3_000026 [Neoechinorhynchus agilis]
MEAIQTARSIGFAPSGEIVKREIASDRKYDQKQFVQLLKELTETRISNDDLKNAFAAFDVGHSGRISLKEFKHALVSLGQEPLSETEINAMLNDIVPDSDGMIALEDFMRMMTGS